MLHCFGRQKSKAKWRERQGQYFREDQDLCKPHTAEPAKQGDLPSWLKEQRHHLPPVIATAKQKQKQIEVPTLDNVGLIVVYSSNLDFFWSLKKKCGIKKEDNWRRKSILRASQESARCVKERRRNDQQGWSGSRDSGAPEARNSCFHVRKRKERALGCEDMNFQWLPTTFLYSS